MTSNIFSHADTLAQLGSNTPLSEKLRFLHGRIREHHPEITRVAIAVYDAASDLLSTFIWSSDVDSPLTNYQARLRDSHSLMEILSVGKPRVVNDMDLFQEHTSEHARVLMETSYRSSYTMPLYADARFLGFVFFNAERTEVFQEHVLIELDMVGHLIALLLHNELAKVHTLVATVRSAQAMTHSRDPETGSHLDRMSRYSRLIAKHLASRYQLTDDYIEHLFLFAPLHDVGKIGIPDDILLKPQKLDPQEFEVMKSHTTKGHEIIDYLIDNYGLAGVSHVDMLRNIALHHHEAVNGSGYPNALKAGQIPLEARIVAVADVFDALTSKRPYKPAWTVDEAFAQLRSLAGSKLDTDCVEALIANRSEVEAIRQRFQENAFG